MTEHEAQAELMILRGLADGGGDLALVRERIDRLYWAVCRKHLRTCKCKNVEKDALLEIYSKLMYHKKTNTTMAQSRLVNGVLLYIEGRHYSNSNLTDEVARKFLAKYPQRKDWFSVLPAEQPQEQGEAKVAEMPEKDSQILSKGIKPQSQATTPKKKKSPKKRK